LLQHSFKEGNADATTMVIRYVSYKVQHEGTQCNAYPCHARFWLQNGDFQWCTKFDIEGMKNATDITIQRLFTSKCNSNKKILVMCLQNYWVRRYPCFENKMSSTMDWTITVVRTSMYWLHNHLVFFAQGS